VSVVWPVAVVLRALIAAPTLDLASSEPVHDAARCPVHANPYLASGTAWPAVAVPMALLLEVGKGTTVRFTLPAAPGSA
jgi:hypothetical protein